MLFFFSLLIFFVSSSVANDAEYKPCTLKDGGSGECIPPHLCLEGKVNRNGTFLIDIRIGADSVCHFLEDCCDTGSLPPVTLPPPTNYGPPVTPQIDRVKTVSETSVPKEIHKPVPRCGLRNPNGIGYRIIEVVDNESEYGEFPWMAAVLKKQGVDEIPDVYAGGGSLIHPSIILTAAHIVMERDPTILKVRVGEWDTTTDNERFDHADYDVHDLEIHPHFDATILYNDVALLFLKIPVYFEAHLGTVCLPSEYENFNHKNCFVSGWGKNRFGKDGHYQTILKKIELPFVSHDDCQAKLRKTRLGKWYELHDSFVCAGGEPDKDPCVGDGGSPLVCPIEGSDNYYFQAGIVAWGIGCGLPDVPGVYVNVAKYRGWIDEQVAKRSYDTVPYTNPPTIG